MDPSNNLGAAEITTRRIAPLLDADQWREVWRLIDADYAAQWVRNQATGENLRRDAELGQEFRAWQNIRRWINATYSTERGA